MSKNKFKEDNHFFKNGKDVFGYEIHNVDISNEEIQKIRKMLNSKGNHHNRNLTIRIDSHSNSYVIPEIKFTDDNPDFVKKKLYLIVIKNDYDDNFKVVFKTSFYGKNDELIMNTYEFGPMNV